jgi:glycerophosphoryl diester phosphodiesterase
VAPCVQVPPATRGVPLVDHRFVRTAHHYGLQVHVWTIDEPAEMTRLLDLGVDAIMTDRPAVLKQLLIDRGRWTGRTASAT